MSVKKAKQRRKQAQNNVPKKVSFWDLFVNFAFKMAVVVAVVALAWAFYIVYSQNFKARKDFPATAVFADVFNKNRTLIALTRVVAEVDLALSGFKNNADVEALRRSLPGLRLFLSQELDGRQVGKKIEVILQEHISLQAGEKEMTRVKECQRGIYRYLERMSVPIATEGFSVARLTRDELLKEALAGARAGDSPMIKAEVEASLDDSLRNQEVGVLNYGMECPTATVIGAEDFNLILVASQGNDTYYQLDPRQRQTYAEKLLYPLHRLRDWVAIARLLRVMRETDKSEGIFVVGYCHENYLRSLLPTLGLQGKIIQATNTTVCPFIH